MTSRNTTTDGTTNSNDAIENALDAACEKLGIAADEPLGEEGVRAILEELDDVLLHRDQVVAAANGDPLPLSEEERLETYGTGTQADTVPERPYEGSQEEVEAAYGVDDVDTDELDEYGTGLSGDTSREDRERREAQAEVLADALERLDERRDGVTDDD